MVNFVDRKYSYIWRPFAPFEDLFAPFANVAQTELHLARARHMAERTHKPEYVQSVPGSSFSIYGSADCIQSQSDRCGEYTIKT